MTRHMRALLTRVAVASLLATAPRTAAADAGVASDASDAGDAETVTEAGTSVDGSSGEPSAVAVPVACDGSLCDTTNQSTCTAGALRGNAPFEPVAVAGLLTALALALARRRRLASVALGFTLLGATSEARAEPQRLGDPAEPPDVVLHEPPPPHRLLLIEWNPLALVAIGKLSANVVVTPGDHHALVLSPFHAWTTTVPIVVFDEAGTQTRLPAQRFGGVGAELGYRYYAGNGGPRGLFLGPSFVVGSFMATAENGTKTAYLDLGAAVDAGYQMLVADRVALSLGAGVQYVAPNRSLPDQQFPASVYANGRVSPRLLFSLGWAL